MSDLDRILKAYDALPESQRKLVDALAEQGTKDMPWVPNPGPQTAAYFSKADELFYGGAAGGGKSDLLLGLAINEHEVSQIFRLQHNDRVSLVRRLGEIITKKKAPPPGYRGDQHVWAGHTNKRDRIIDFGALSTPDAWLHYMGRPADLKGWDELPQFRRQGYKTVNQWLRSTSAGQRCRVVGAGNPPLEPDQFWVVEEYAPWLDPRHPNPAGDGELRYFATIDGEEVEVDADWRGVMIVGGEEVEIKPVSRTFIRALLQDNADLAETDYGSRLANSPLAEHLLLGKFDASVKDAPMQLIPTDWILAAQERWRKRQNDVRGPMTCVGVDPCGGGNDEFGISPLYGTFFGEHVLGKGIDFKSPRKGAAFVIENIDGDPQLNIDCTGGYGAGIVEHLEDAYACKAMMMSASSPKRSKCKMRYEFENKRAEYMWGLREALDPESGDDIALPPDRRVVAELAAPGYMLRGRRILIEPKEKIIARLGRSPTILDTTAYAWAESEPADRAERPSSRRRKRTTQRSVTVQTSYASARAKYSR